MIRAYTLGITKCRPRVKMKRGPASRRIGTDSTSERDHAADAVLALHQFEAPVDLPEGEPVGDERVDVDLAVEVALHECGNAVAPLDSADARAGHAPPGG